MSRPLDLASATAKLNRANAHARKLDKLVRDWINHETNPPIRPGFKDEPEHRRTLAYVKSLKRIPGRWYDLLGDALNNYRSALNHVVGAMVLVGERPEEFENLASTFQFPVCDKTRSIFLAPKGNICQNQLPGVLRKHVKAISPFQPYQGRSDRWALPALKLLNDLDKHRRPVLAVHYVATMGTIQPMPPIVRTRSLRPRGPMEPGAKLAYLEWIRDRPIIDAAWPFRLHGQPNMTVRFGPIGAVVLEDLSSIREVFEALDAFDALVSEVIRKVSAV